MTTNNSSNIVNNHILIPPYVADLTWRDPLRASIFSQWVTSLTQKYALVLSSLQLASADASFRRYFRIHTTHVNPTSYIIMDAPPVLEDCSRFVEVATLMHEAGIRVPDILEWDRENGFLLLSDLGGQTFLQAIHDQPNNANLPEELFKQALPILVRLQVASKPDVLPVYDEHVLRREIELFPEWYIGKYRQYSLNEAQKNSLNEVFGLIVKHNLSSAKVYVHRDFMPRNIMVGVPLEDGTISEPGVLDFQDALYGPISYDIASFMRDAFQSWDEEFVLDMTIRYWEMARKASLPVPADFADFWVDVEWMGLQRHLKILGIFARLTLRDGKARYLEDTPRFIQYVRATCSRYRDLKPLLHFVDQMENIHPQYGYQYGR